MNRKSTVVLPAVITFTAGLVMLSDVASAQRAPARQPTGLKITDTRAITTTKLDEGGLAGVSFSENFEGFTPGAGCLQNGWNGFCGDDGSGQPVFEIDVPTDPVMGALTAFHNSDGTLAFAADIFSPLFTLEIGRTDMDIIISDTATTYFVQTQNTLAGFVNTRVQFNLDGTITTLQVTDPACTVGVFSATTGTWTAGVRMRIGIETDGTALRLYKDGSLIFTGTDINNTCNPAGAPGFDQLVVLSDNLVGTSSLQIDNIAPGGAPPCLGDLDGSGAVDVDDLIAVILDWGCTGASCTGDADDNGVVDVDDLIAVILNWGAC